MQILVPGWGGGLRLCIPYRPQDMWIPEYLDATWEQASSYWSIKPLPVCLGTQDFPSFFFFFLGFIYCWLCWVFVALGGLPPVVVNGASLHCSVRFLVVATSLVVEHRL